MTADPPRPEADLVAACARGERAAWEEFVDRFGPLLVALARRMLARRTGSAQDPDVDEVVAEVFLALLRRDRILLKRYDERFRVSTYLGVICRTEVLRHLRRGNRRPASLADAGHVRDRSGAPGAAGTLQAEERETALAALREALQELSDRDRLLLTMRYLDGHDYRTIGAALGVSAESVGQLLHRAKTRLARRVPHLERYLQEVAEGEA
jgi:RNA polymerase sigma-70 factor (ECF subfamily)